jgi:hypothetical protein
VSGADQPKTSLPSTYFKVEFNVGLVAPESVSLHPQLIYFNKYLAANSISRSRSRNHQQVLKYLNSQLRLWSITSNGG